MGQGGGQLSDMGQTLGFPNPPLGFGSLRYIPANAGHRVFPLVEDPFHLVFRRQGQTVFMTAEVHIKVRGSFTGHALFIEFLHRRE